MSVSIVETRLGRATTRAGTSLSALTLGEIKAAVEAFERGVANLCDAWNGITVAVDGCRTVMAVKPDRKHAPRGSA